MSLSPQFLDELRSRTMLSTLIGKAVKLQKAGREFRACCPFHNERSPSFYVNDEKGFYHCFGCGAHGDAIRWMTDQQGLPFMDAVKELAATAGMDLPASDPRAQERQKRGAGLLEAMAAAARWFEDQLAGIEGAEARTYLDRRGITEDHRRAFGIGYAPDTRGKLKTALERFGNDILIEAGLLISVEGKEPYDRFRGRLMIPIRDPRGRVIAFGGRILGEGEPKYLNSPDTPLFDKGRTLYNLDRAAPAGRKSGRLILVEGYMDVIALTQAGLSEVVAPLGTAMTETQIARLWQITDIPILCFDGDAAGQKAATRAAIRALPGLQPGRSLRFVSLPHGLDPDDLVRKKGRDAFDSLVESALPLSELLWIIEELAQPLDTPEAKAGLKQRLYEHTLTIRDQTVRTQYQAMFNNRLASITYAEGKVGRKFLERGVFSSPSNFEILKNIAKSGIDEAVIVPALFSGLLRHCSLISRHAEALMVLPIREGAMARFRDTLIDIALSAFPITPEKLASELKRHDHVKTWDRLVNQTRPRFSFLNTNSTAEIAERDLALVIEKLAQDVEIVVQLETLTERLKNSHILSESELIEQARLRDAASRGMQELKDLLTPYDQASV